MSIHCSGLVVDILGDLRLINKLAMRSVNTGTDPTLEWETLSRSTAKGTFLKLILDPSAGMIILGGGLIKHHICNANLMRNGADFSLFVNTASEFDGSDSGAR